MQTNKWYRKVKKGFTLVELLVVIAILAILATVSIVGYTSFIKKAKESNDQTLVAQLNKVLTASAVLDGQNETCYDAVQDCIAAGYDVQKLTPTSDGEILWDSKNDCFVYLAEGTTEPEYVGATKIVTDVADVDYFKIYNGKVQYTVEQQSTSSASLFENLFGTPTAYAAEEHNYSVYLGEGALSVALLEQYKSSGNDFLKFTVGIDTGDYTNINVQYDNKNAQTNERDVIIRTGSASINVTIFASNSDTVLSYITAGVVSVEKSGRQAITISTDVAAVTVSANANVTIWNGVKVGVVNVANNGTVTISAEATVTTLYAGSSAIVINQNTAKTNITIAYRTDSETVEDRTINVVFKKEGGNVVVKTEEEIKSDIDTTVAEKNEEEKSSFTYNKENGGLTITGLNEGVEVTTLFIPSTINGEPVLAIGNEAFKDNTTIKTVVISEGVTTIGASAFSGCASLESVTIPSTVNFVLNDVYTYEDLTSIFSDCVALKNVTLNTADTNDNLNTFCALVAIFYSNKNDDEVNNTVETIHLGKNAKPTDSDGDMPLAYFVNLRSLTVDDENETYWAANNCLVEKESNTLVYCATNTGSVEIPDGVEVIGSYTFLNKEITSVTIPDSVTEIEEVAFSSDSLSSVQFGSGVKTIGAEAFMGTALTSVIIPDSVTCIGSGAFGNIETLTSICIGSGLETLDSDGGVFGSCSNLQTITVSAYNTNFKAEGNVLFSHDGTFLILCAANRENTIYTVPDNVVTIEYGAFQYSNITEVTIPASVKSIGEYAFYNCSQLTKVTLNEGLETIGERAFQYTAIENIVIPNTVTTIGHSAFFYCEKLEWIVIGNGVKTIDKYVFPGSPSYPNELPALKAIYYKGTETDWKKIDIKTDGKTYGTNEKVKDYLYFYSETHPTDTEHKYWHYDSESNQPTSYGTASNGEDE